MNASLNLYGDELTVLSANKGADIATQRADDLDQASVAYAQERPGALVLDLACGAGGQARRLLDAGAEVVGLDFPDLAMAFVKHTQSRAQFVGMNMANLEAWFLKDYAGAFTQITCQRAIHYLPRKQALQVLVQLRGLLSPGGALFISCSGLRSELGEGYEGQAFPPETRFHTLAAAMAEKHSIKQPVCLYTEEEFQALLEEAGFRITTIYASAFGNIKTIAQVA